MVSLSREASLVRGEATSLDNEGEKTTKREQEGDGEESCTARGKFITIEAINGIFLKRAPSHSSRARAPAPCSSWSRLGAYTDPLASRYFVRLHVFVSVCVRTRLM